LGTILLVRTEGDESIVVFIRAELRTSAWLVVEIGPEPWLVQARLAELAASQGAAAALRVHPDQAQIELWVAQPVGSSEGTFEMLDVPGSRPDDRVLALRATEALRARGLRLDPVIEAAPAAAVQPEPQAQAAAEPAPPQPAPTKPLPVPVASEPASDGPVTASFESPSFQQPEPIPPRLALELAPALALSSGGLGPALDGFVAVRWRFAAALSISGFALAPIFSERLEEPEGSARISTFIFGGAADVHVGGARWELRIGPGLGGVVSLMDGAASAPFKGVHQTVTAAAPLGHAAVRLALGHGWGLSVGALAGLTFPALSIVFAQRVAAHWGRPFAVFTLGIEAPLVDGNLE
jgi:hypothetical protein